MESMTDTDRLDIAITLLRRLEWAGLASVTSERHCLSCERFRHHGHAPGCQLAEVLGVKADRGR